VNKTVLWIGGGVIGLALIVLLAMSIAGEQTQDSSIGFGTVSVEGDVLPGYTGDPTTDPAIGFTAPTVSGADWEDNPTTIAADGRSKIIIFLAHWCPHCQNEVPIVQDWLDEGNLPDGVDMYAITVATDRLRPNWPPQDWLEDEGWTPPVIMDDEIGSAAVAYGMAGTPFYVVLDGDNNTMARISGEIGLDGLNTLASLASGV